MARSGRRTLLGTKRSVCKPGGKKIKKGREPENSLLFRGKQGGKSLYLRFLPRGGGERRNEKESSQFSRQCSSSFFSLLFSLSPSTLTSFSIPWGVWRRFFPRPLDDAAHFPEGEKGGEKIPLPRNKAFVGIVLFFAQANMFYTQLTRNDTTNLITKGAFFLQPLLLCVERNKSVDLCPGLLIGVYFYSAVSACQV